MAVAIVSKIKQVQPNFQSVSKQEHLLKGASNQNFRGGLADLPKDSQKIILNGVETKIDKSLGKSGKFYQWLADTKGELQVQIINGIFTTTLAPLMIVCNPFAKNKTKEDKEYLALRQPVSAIIALAGGLTMTKATNMFMDSIYNSGSVKTIDLRLAPGKDSLKSAFSKELKKAEKDGKVKEFLAQYDSEVSDKIKENSFKNAKPSGAYKSACFKFGYMKKVKDQRLDLFTNLLVENPANIKIDSANNIVVGSKNLQEGHLLKVPNLGTQEELNKYIDENSLHKIKFRDFMKQHFKFEFFAEKDGELGGKFKPYTINTELGNIKALDFLKEVGLIEDGKVTENELRKTLAAFQQSRNENTLKNDVFREGVLKPDGAMKMQEVAGKISSRITEMTVGEEIGHEKSISLGQLLHQLQIKPSNGKLQELMDMNMTESLEKFNGLLKGKLKGFNKNADLKYFAKNLVKNSAARMSQDAGTHKFYVGIVINLFTTAITCTALNWAYPRFVDTFFPSLTKDKKDSQNQPKPIETKEGGNK